MESDPIGHAQAQVDVLKQRQELQQKDHNQAPRKQIECLESEIAVITLAVLG